MKACLPALAGSVYNLPGMEKGYCGLDCSSCPGSSDEFPRKARELREFVKDLALAESASSIPGGDEIDFCNLDRALTWIGEMSRDTGCPGCKEGGGSSDCGIRLCAREKKLENCVSCSALEPCERFGFLPGVIKERLLAEKCGGR